MIIRAMAIPMGKALNMYEMFDFEVLSASLSNSSTLTLNS